MHTHIAPTVPTHRTSTAVPTGFRRRLATVTGLSAGVGGTDDILPYPLRCYRCSENELEIQGWRP